MAAATAVFAPASATAQLLLHRRRSRSRRIYSCGPAIALARLSSSLCGGVRQRPISPSCGYGRAPLVPASDNWGNWTFLLSTAALGTWSEKRSPVGKALTGALVSLLLGLAASSAGVVAAGATAYRVALDYLLPLAIPLLLFRADLRRRRRGVFRSTGSLLLAFLLGSGTCLSIIFLRRVCRMPSLNIFRCYACFRSGDGDGHGGGVPARPDAVAGAGGQLEDRDSPDDPPHRWR